MSALDRDGNVVVYANDGMTLRDYLAGQVIGHLIVSPMRSEATTEQDTLFAYRVADAMLKARFGRPHSDEARANARLFSAAEDLLAACVEFVRKCDSGAARSEKSYAQMVAAIAKATGDAT